MSYVSVDIQDSDILSQLFKSRAELIDNTVKAPFFDVLVIGGGIHGACFARLAALNGLKTVLLEKNDYASGTSSKSSRMIHGGLRYLEMFDLRQVYEGLKAREDLFNTAAHLVKPARFLIPARADRRLFNLKLRAGLSLYSLLTFNKERRYEWVGREKLADLGSCFAQANFRGAFSYVDGVTNDSRLVLENIIAARQEGAICLNYAEVAHLKQLPSGQIEVNWRDMLKGREEREIRAGIVVNCAGPWVPYVGRIAKSPGLASMLVYSKGSHLLFNREWRPSPLLLPLGEKGRYYFVLPYYNCTLVGTTEREIDSPAVEPIPAEDEVSEILSRLRRDLPDCGLDRSSLYYAFSGIRSLVRLTKKGRKSSDKISRRHLWHYHHGMLNLLGGKLTTASWTAYEGLKLAHRLAGRKRKVVKVAGRKLPGAGSLDSAAEDFRKVIEIFNVSPIHAQRALDRFGSRVRYMEPENNDFSTVGDAFLKGELELAIRMEQAEKLEDVLSRRLDLENLPGHGIDVIQQIIKRMKKHRQEDELRKEALEYQNRVKNTKKTLGL